MEQLTGEQKSQVKDLTRHPGWEVIKAYLPAYVAAVENQIVAATGPDQMAELAYQLKFGSLAIYGLFEGAESIGKAKEQKGLDKS